MSHDPGDEDVPTIDHPLDEPDYRDWDPARTRILKYAVGPAENKYTSWIPVACREDALEHARRMGRILGTNSVIDEEGTELIFVRIPRKTNG